MASTRRARIPISCEPCRSRKIRCARDGSPCATCLRRKVSPTQCVYLTRRFSTGRPASPALPSATSASTSSLSSSNPDLAVRVANLERLFQAQNRSDPSPSSLNGPGSNLSDDQLIARNESSLVNDFDQPLVAGMAARGKLYVSKSGHVRFIPSHSAWGSSTPVTSDDNCAFTDFADGLAPFGTGRSTSVLDSLALLPPSSLCTRLKDIYFTSFAPLFHILHDPTFEEQYASFEENPESTPLAWLALLFAILGTAATALSQDSDIANELSWRRTTAEEIGEVAERYRTAALRCLEADNYLWQHNITTVQALVVLIYGISHSHGQSWSLLGLAHHIALSIGCHVDPLDFKLGLIECEERRRCWAGLMMLYTIQNCAMGNLGPPHQSSSYSISMPADLNDFDLAPDGIQLPSPSGNATQMSYLILKFRLYELCSNICSRVLHAADPSAATIQGLDQAEPLPFHHTVHLNILYGYSHQLILLLHRPNLLKSFTHRDQFLKSRARCIQSASSILEIHSLFHDSPDFEPFAWYHRGLGSFHAFHAVLTLLAICSVAPRSMDYRSISQLVQPCLDRLEDMMDMSLICRKAAPVVRHMLNHPEVWAEMTPQTLPSGEVQRLRSAESRTSSRQLTSPGVYVEGVGDSEHNTASQALHTDGLDLLVEQLDPLEWLTPSAMQWDHWNNFVTNSAALSN